MEKKKRNVRPRYAPLKVGMEVKLKKDGEGLLNGVGKQRFRRGTTGLVTVPKLINGNVVVDIFLLGPGTKSYEIERSNIQVVKEKPLPRRLGRLLEPAERVLLLPEDQKQLAVALANQKRARNDMLRAIQTYADTTAIVSMVRRQANKNAK